MQKKSQVSLFFAMLRLSVMSATLTVDTRVRVNWKGKGKYYDARIIEAKESGFTVEYLVTNEIEENVRRDNIIGMFPSFPFLPPPRACNTIHPLPHTCNVMLSPHTQARRVIFWNAPLPGAKKNLTSVGTWTFRRTSQT